ncbi:EAL domain-containing protein [Gemmatimonas sp.]|uniref:putative bifunctional diguanylate cyclase/phosphodiesterase n=1 Tax=Gemmatimonas sp. TaxID=1962908 RepID=UPI00286E0B56|nr:EAL domain-containing protein [Gemmatimonas sp.]
MPLPHTTSSSFRAIVLPAARQARATALAFLGGALVFFIFEASKSAVFPKLTIWESHSITIVFGSCIAAGAAFLAMKRQASMLSKIAAEAALRERLEMRQRVLQESEARYRLLVDNSPEAIAVHRNGHLVYVNAAGAALIGSAPGDDLVGRRTIDFVHRDDLSLVRQRARPDASRVQYRLIRVDGAIREVDAASVEIPYEGTSAIQTVFRDVTERKQLEARLMHEAFHDALTGLPNRSLFRDRLEHAVAVQMRQPTLRVVVMFLDLDDFKAVNDSLGHEAGDQLLQVVAERIREEIRAADTVARFGGDEFAILMEQVSAPAEVLSIVNRIKVSLRRPLLLQGRLMSVSASVGVAFAESGEDVDTLLRNADVAMYEAKEAGKARHAVFEPAMYTAIMHRLQLESDLRAATVAPESAGLFLTYQPIVDLRSGEMRGVEALLRWHHATRGPIPPMVFVPVAEHTGTIIPLGNWVLETACRQLVAWRTLWWTERWDPASMPSVAVNISGKQLQEPDFVATVADILARTNAPAHCITLEITESVIMRDTESSLQTLRALKTLGVRLAIDDFGTGYSSLSYLQRFPVDVLKIDRAFVEGVSRGGSDAALARTILTLGETLGLQTVAEGVEDESQRVQLERMGCVLAQGYLFSRPKPADELTAWIRSRAEALPDAWKAAV